MRFLVDIDRRWIFLLLFVTLIPAVIWGDRFVMPVVPSEPVKGVWRAMEALPPRAPVLFGIDYDPGSRAELEPMARSAFRQLYRKNVRVICMTHWPQGLQMASHLVDETAAEFDDVAVRSLGVFPTRADASAFIVRSEGRAPSGTAVLPALVNVGHRRAEGIAWRPELEDALKSVKTGLVVAPSAGQKGFEVLEVLSRMPTLKYGEDYVFLGTKAGNEALVIAMGESLTTAFPIDPRSQQPTRDLPIMKGVASLRDVSYLIDVAAGSTAEWFIIFGSQKYRFPMGVCCTAVMAPDEYPYYGAHMITGLCGGMKGAWEYEKLVDTPGSATKAIPPQTFAHCLVVALILFCNIAYFAGGRRKA